MYEKEINIWSTFCVGKKKVSESRAGRIGVVSSSKAVFHSLFNSATTSVRMDNERKDIEVTIVRPKMGTEIYFRKWNQDVLASVLEAAAAAAHVQARLLGTVLANDPTRRRRVTSPHVDRAARSSGEASVASAISPFGWYGITADVRGRTDGGRARTRGFSPRHTLQNVSLRRKKLPFLLESSSRLGHRRLLTCRWIRGYSKGWTGSLPRIGEEEMVRGDSLESGVSRRLREFLRIELRF